MLLYTIGKLEKSKIANQPVGICILSKRKAFVVHVCKKQAFSSPAG